MLHEEAFLFIALIDLTYPDLKGENFTIFIFLLNLNKARLSIIIIINQYIDHQFLGKKYCL